ncbi:MAG: radical SAM protein [Candidatus Omnitrophica bacterium]|nr:radical SAM protein [Candidatus Omnitrophota bacterium]
MKKTIALVLAPVFWPNLPPLSLIALGSFLLRQGEDVRLVDANNLFFNRVDETYKKAWLKSTNRCFEESAADLLKKEYSKQWQELVGALAGYAVAGFSCYRSNLPVTLVLARELRRMNSAVKIVFGGPEITRDYFKTGGKFSPELRQSADLLVAGEGEKPLADFIQGRLKVPTVCFDELDGLRGHDYIAGYRRLRGAEYPRKKTVSLLLSRGCRRTCRFCSERLLYTKVRMRDIDDVLSEIRFHKQEQEVDTFVIHDSMINTDLKFLEDFCDAVIAEFGSIAWEAQMGIRPDMPEPLLGKLKQSGCYNLFIGLESGSGQTLRRMRKGFSPADAALFFKKLHAAGLRFGVSIIVGFPGETQEDCEESLRFLIVHKAVIPKIEQINPFVYYDGIDCRAPDTRDEAVALRRTEYVITRLRQEGFRMTNAFVNNLIGKPGGPDLKPGLNADYSGGIR